MAKPKPQRIPELYNSGDEQLMQAALDAAGVPIEANKNRHEAMTRCAIVQRLAECRIGGIELGYRVPQIVEQLQTVLEAEYFIRVSARQIESWDRRNAESRRMRSSRTG